MDFDKKLNQYINPYTGQHIKPSSINIYKGSVKKIFREVFNKDDITDIKLLYKHNKISKYVKQQPILKQKALYNSILTTLRAYKSPKYVRQKYLKEVEGLRETIDKDLLDVKQDDLKIIDDKLFKKVGDHLDYLINKSKPDDPYYLFNIQKKLIFLLYTETTPQRREWVDTKVINDFSINDDLDRNFNYLSIRDKKLYKFNHKTDKKQGLLTLNLNDKIINFVKFWMTLNKNKDRFLLINSMYKTGRGGELETPDKMNGSNLSKMINKIFGDGITIQKLRRAYAKKDEMAVKKIKQVAGDMGHTITTHNKYYVGV